MVAEILAHGSFANRFDQIDWFSVFLAFMGAVALYVLTKNKNREPLSFFRAVNIRINSRSHPGAVLADLTITSGLGAFLACLLTDPKTNAQAIMTGLGYVGLLSAFGKETDAAAQNPTSATSKTHPARVEPDALEVPDVDSGTS